MAVNSIFSNRAFGIETLTDAINDLPFQPTKARSLGIFRNSGVSTTSIDLESKGGVLSLIPATKRGSPAPQYRSGSRSMRTLKIPHLQLEDTINPEEIQNVRQFGSANQLLGPQEVVNERMAEMVLSHDATLEYQSIGAIKGVIYDANGTDVIYNLFTEFGVTQTTVDFDLGDTSNNIKHLCLTVKRSIEEALGALTYTGIYCFCGKDWFDAFVAHPDVEEAYQRWQANGQVGAFLRDDNRKGFDFCGITFEEYVGSVDGIDFVPDGEAHFFPLGVPGLFRTVFAPANRIDTVNTMGYPRYAWTEELRGGRGLQLFTESNPLAYCTRPKVLVKGYTSTYPTGIGD